MRRVLAVAVVLGLACAGGPKPADTAADVAAIGKVRDAYAAAWKAGDGAALSALFASDGHQMENMQPTGVGPQAVQAAIAAFNKDYTPTNIAIISEKTEVVGDMAYDRGTVKLSAAPKTAGPPPLTDSVRYLVVLRRQTDGSWKLAEAMGNSMTPMPAAPPAAPGKKK